MAAEGRGLRRARVLAAPAAWLLVLLALLTLLTLLPPARTALEGRLEAGSHRALAAFAVARGINAAISVIQETEIGLSLGINITTEPGQALDPVNDLVERFSLAALAGAAVLAVLRLLLALFGDPVLVAALWVAGGAAAGLALAGRARLAAAVQRPLAAVLALWLFVLATPIATDLVHRAPPVRDRAEAAAAALEAARARLARFDLTAATPDRETVRGWLAEAQALADTLAEQAVLALAVLLLETVVVPLAALWLGLRAVGALLRPLPVRNP
ncbi:hypothetical protein [Inmirania thermothiophila]|uniref:Uncharacterized protein n=1 Tax=Inmirania thermothiophila TaxID=1750597 RepID=A0A3N1Y440_9GAMM|nr:hypothetical protein [Inmirania thermothiophila]ROR32382.1 hypothetical protein EDC57_1582 [Inmirania thermothiophila]